MAYVEVRRDGKLITRRIVDDAEARKGCRIRVGSAGKIQLAIGESKTVGKYQVVMYDGQPSEDGNAAVDGLRYAANTFPVISETEQQDFSHADEGKQNVAKGKYPLIEGYEIVGRLGQGGMGTVWKAIQLSTKREVALKFLSRNRFASDKSRARFEREVSLAARLTHPGIARVYHSGIHRGVYFYAMELIEGDHLDKYVQKHKLSQKEILDLIKQVCDAVHHAHKQGIIHRDLKPSNILVTEDGKPHVVDFGLAKSSIKEEADFTISIEGEVTGTPAYMAPEQAAGRTKLVNFATDVYSLGVIMYRLLTGNYPHDMSGSRYDIFKRIVEGEIKDPRKYSSDINHELECLVMKALSKDQDLRYLSAGDMADDIDNYLKGEPLMARSMSGTYLIRKQFKKYRKKAAIISGVIMLFLALLTVAHYRVNSERRKRIIAERREDITDYLNELSVRSRSAAESDQDTIIKEVVRCYQHAWKTVHASRMLELVISDRAYVATMSNRENPSEALILDKAALIASIGTTIITKPVEEYYEMTPVLRFGPLAYVAATCTRPGEEGRGLVGNIIYFLAKDQTGWKVISHADAGHIKNALDAKSGNEQTTSEEENAKVAIRDKMDRINRSWASKNGSTVLNEVLSDKAFAFALKHPDNPSVAMVLDKRVFCELYDQMQQEGGQLQKMEHKIESIAVFGPLAYEVGTTRNTYPDGTQTNHRSLNAFAKEGTRWKQFFSGSADHIRMVLKGDSDSDKQIIRKLAEEYVNTFQLHEPFDIEKINRICSDDITVIMSGGDIITGKADYIKTFRPGLEKLQSTFDSLDFNLEIQSIKMSEGVWEVLGIIEWRGRLKDGPEPFERDVPVSLTFRKIDGKWLLVREHQGKVVAPGSAATGKQTGQATDGGQANAGAAIISDFDGENPLVPPLFPNTGWRASKGNETATSICQLDSEINPVSHPYCLRWDYQIEGTWANVNLLLSGSWGKPVDLSQYDSISFYIKSLRQRGCALKVQAGPRTGEEHHIGIEIQLATTSKWQKIEIPFKTHPEVAKIDLTRVYTLEFVDWDETYAANTIWLDDIVLYLATITSEQESEFVFSLIDNPLYWKNEQHPEEPHSRLVGPWLGGYQPPGSSEPLGSWAWVTGESFKYSNWQSDQPNNFLLQRKNKEHDKEGQDHLLYYVLGEKRKPKWNDEYEYYKGTKWIPTSYVIEFSDHKVQPDVLRQLENARSATDYMQWWRDAKFGMLVSWGLYAIPAGQWNDKEIHGFSEWIMDKANIPLSQYKKLAREFNPTSFDAHKWVTLAKQAGMKYLVLTTKHQDGFCLWDSKHTDFDVMDATPFKRDIAREIADECRQQGIKIGWYYSIRDLNHPDYLPRRKGDKRSRSNADYNRYFTYVTNQVTELLTNYGTIDIMWFDAGWHHTWTPQRGEVLEALVRSLQPHIVINNNVGKRPGESGDYDVTEQKLPVNPSRDWETCMTTNDSWGYKKNDHNWKSTNYLLDRFREVTGKGGNFLLNVGPDARGIIPEPAVTRLKAMGREINKGSVNSNGSMISEVDLNKGLVLHCDFENVRPGGKVIDKSGKGNHGQVEGARWVDNGISGKAFKFDINNKTDAIVVPDDDSLDVENITMSAWIKSTCMDHRWNRIIGKHYRGYVLGLGGESGQKIFRGKVAGEFIGHSGFIDSDIIVADGRWHHIVCTNDGKKLNLYIDGILHKTRNAKGPIALNNFDLAIGNSKVPYTKKDTDPKLKLDHYPADWCAFDGLIDEV